MSDVRLRYKYVAFNEGALAIIKDGTMKFTNPSDFNDPFDCLPEVDVKALRKDTEKWSKQFIKRSRKERRLSISQYFTQKPKDQKRLETHLFNDEHFIKINSGNGICSLSRNPLNLLMWAHYAKNHTGFVVEFATPVSIKNQIQAVYNLAPLPVEYKKEKPIVVSGTSLESMNQWIFTKSIDWEYEQEERVFNPEQTSCNPIHGVGIKPYNRKQILKSVIAGMRMSDEDFATLKNTVATVNQELGIHVTVHKAEAVKGKFALYVPDRDDLNIHSTP